MLCIVNRSWKIFAAANGSTVIGDGAAGVVIPPTTTIGKKINVINFAKITFHLFTIIKNVVRNANV